MRAAFVLAGLAFVATAHGDGVALPQQVQNALTPIDVVPTKTELDAVFTDTTQALASLSAIAGDSTTDPGIRLRAIHALGKYCTSPCSDADVAHLALHDFIIANQDATAGATIVMLRGAIEAIGPQRDTNDLGLLEGLLTHSSRDIRAAAVHGLRDLCDTQAITALRIQNEREPTDQVKQAITDALRVLGQPQPCQ